jgi:hypothetical protein
LLGRNLTVPCDLLNVLKECLGLGEIASSTDSAQFVYGFVKPLRVVSLNVSEDLRGKLLLRLDRDFDALGGYRLRAKVTVEF